MFNLLAAACRRFASIVTPIRTSAGYRRYAMKTIPIVIAMLMPAFALDADDFAAIQPLVQTYCIGCHGAERQKGDLRLDRLTALDAEMFESIYERIAGGEMPPDNQRQPTQAQRTVLMRHALELATKDSAVTSTGFRRLNKREYGNTVKDLLGLRKGTFDPGSSIYDDEVDEGFDTRAESLVISNELLLEYMGAAEKSLRQALFSADVAKPGSRVVEVDLAKMAGGSRRYVTFDRQQAILRVGGAARIYEGGKTRAAYLPGRYTLTVTASGIDRDRYPVKFQPEQGPLILGMGVVPEASETLSGGGSLLEQFELQDNVEQTIQCDLWIDKGYFPYLSFVNGPSKPITQIRSNIRRRKLPPSAMNEPFVGPGIRVTQYQIEGPFHDQWPPASFRTTYGMDTVPDFQSAPVREQLIRRFAARAFRRPVAAEEIIPYLRFLETQNTRTRDWHESLIKTFAAMMTSIDFLYIREGQGELDSYELANRLSYFFWSTMPDDQLFTLAKSGKLTEPSVLSEQVLRMLDDTRSERFSHSFADQWLSLGKLGSMPPDSKGEFREYYRQNLEPAMLEETHRFFRHVLHQNRSVGDFIDSDYSFVNKGLAELYGVPLKRNDADDFQRVTFPAEAKRGGLLGHGSILTLSANGVETSPIERGVWVLADLLGTPPPPPPKEVPALTPDLNGAVTVRDMLEKHRSDPACMQCHRRMDPLGFALEAYDPIGRLRTKYSQKQPISTHGNYLGKDFSDVTELKQILSSNIRPFARNLIIRIAEYAKGRKLVAADYATVQQLVDQSAKNGFKFKDIVIAIATSDLMMER